MHTRRSGYWAIAGLLLGAAACAPVPPIPRTSDRPSVRVSPTPSAPATTPVSLSAGELGSDRTPTEQPVQPPPPPASPGAARSLAPPPTLAPGCQAPIETYMVGTIAGNGEPGFSDGTGDEARLNKPAGLAFDKAGRLYVADSENHRIRRLTYKTDCGWTLETVAGGSGGYADGPADSAKFNNPRGLAFNAAGDLYVADYSNHRIRKLTFDPGSPAMPPVVSTVAGSGIGGFQDGAAATAEFWHPTAVAAAVGEEVGALYVADSYNHRVRRIALATPGGLRVTTVAGGAVSAASPPPATALSYPTGIAVGGAGILFVADSRNHRLMRLTADDEGLYSASVVAGGAGAGSDDGSGSEASLSLPGGLIPDGLGGVYLADTENHTVRRLAVDKLKPSHAPVLSTLVGRGGSGFGDGGFTQAVFNHPLAVAMDGKGNLFVADTDNHRVRLARRAP